MVMQQSLQLSWGCCIDPQDETLIIYRELYQKGLNRRRVSFKNTEFEREDKLSVAGVLDTAAWARTGTYWSYCRRSFN